MTEKKQVKVVQNSKQNFLLLFFCKFCLVCQLYRSVLDLYIHVAAATEWQEYHVDAAIAAYTHDSKEKYRSLEIN